MDGQRNGIRWHVVTITARLQGVYEVGIFGGLQNFKAHSLGIIHLEDKSTILSSTTEGASDEQMPRRIKC